MARRARVHASAIASMFLPTGQVGQEGARLIREARGLAQRVVPVRTGQLKRSIGSDRKGSNQFHARFTLFAGDKRNPWDHALAVLLGTLTHPPRPKPGHKAMVLYAIPRNPAAARPRYFKHIGQRVLKTDGQKANDFLGRSLNTTMRRNGY
jgi:hypothetical protein